MQPPGHAIQPSCKSSEHGWISLGGQIDLNTQTTPVRASIVYEYGHQPSIGAGMLHLAGLKSQPISKKWDSYSHLLSFKSDEEWTKMRPALLGFMDTVRGNREEHQDG